MYLTLKASKSQLLGIGVPPETINQGASLIGCGVLHTPFNYLGVLVGNLMSRHSAWTSVIQKLRARLSNWKVKTLSIGAPKQVLHEMEQVRSNFFNGADQSERKISWVAWDKTLASKEKGGLGISSFHALNRALLLKWVWRFISQDGSFWSKTRWLSSNGFNFVARCKKRAGDGQNTKFWLDAWKSDIPFRLFVFLGLFDLEVDRGLLLLRWLSSVVIPFVGQISGRNRASAVDRIPTRCNLAIRGVALDSSLCPLCGLVPEDVAHVLFRCE
ncbi:hypothetical protein Tco_0550932, partial [Tanacetum coccineum]